MIIAEMKKVKLLPSLKWEYYTLISVNTTAA